MNDNTKCQGFANQETTTMIHFHRSPIVLHDVDEEQIEETGEAQHFYTCDERIREVKSFVATSTKRKDYFVSSKERNCHTMFGMKIARMTAFLVLLGIVFLVTSATSVAAIPSEEDNVVTYKRRSVKAIESTPNHNPAMIENTTPVRVHTNNQKHLRVVREEDSSATRSTLSVSQLNTLFDEEHESDRVLKEQTSKEEEDTSTSYSGESEPAHAVLFPWFMQAIGLLSFYLLTRYASWLPYTAWIFLIGTFMGVGTARLANHNQLASSILNYWLNIPSELLFLAFLPGIIMKDASSLNIHLFEVAIWQCIVFAFPLVLMGTTLTALVAYYILPYGWSFYLAMTFGSILSATDPVAVNALMAQLGAPSRLMIHISGESLLNDGSAIVFYHIFSQMWFATFGTSLEEVHTYTFASGFGMFCRMSIGGALIGCFFGGILWCILYGLDRRLNREENVTQVVATLTAAYLCYYTAEVVWGTSGIIATLSLGLFTQVVSSTLISDVYLLEDCWSLVESILNTVVFGLGGLVWGGVISNSTSSIGEFTSQDWGYLVLLYILLMVIRFFIFGVAYPLTKWIGLSTNWKEYIFQCFGGLRGSVGIALAIAIDNTVQGYSSSSGVQGSGGGDNSNNDGYNYALQTNKLFGFVGGIAAMTLLINATLAGPLLKKLGLTDSSNVRQNIVKCEHDHYRQHLIMEMLKLLSQERFFHVNFAMLREHVEPLKEMTLEELNDAVTTYRQQNQYKSNFHEPSLTFILPYLMSPNDNDDDDDRTTIDVNDEEEGDISRKNLFIAEEDEDEENDDDEEEENNVQQEEENEEEEEDDVHPNQQYQHDKDGKEHQQDSDDGNNDNNHRPNQQDADDNNYYGRSIELRQVFLQIVQSSYQRQMAEGELFQRGFLAFGLTQSVEFANDKLRSSSSSESPRLTDWECLRQLELPLAMKVHNHGTRIQRFIIGFIKGCCGTTVEHNFEFEKMRMDIEGCLAFLEAHTYAQETFHKHIDEPLFQHEGTQVLKESHEECQRAVQLLKEYPKDVRECITSHKMCSIMLNKGAQYIHKMNACGLLKHTEAEEMLQTIGQNLKGAERCTKFQKHDGEMNQTETRQRAKLSSSSKSRLSVTSGGDENRHDDSKNKQE